MAYHDTPVVDFHRAFGHPVEQAPTVPSLAQRLLRVKLLAEELCEFARASGVVLKLDSHQQDDGNPEWVRVYDSDGPVDVTEAADALADIRYVVDGSNLVWGFPGEALLAEVHASNMSKLDADGKPITREDGKTLKGPNYFRPRIREVMNAACVANVQQAISDGTA